MSQKNKTNSKPSNDQTVDYKKILLAVSVVFLLVASSASSFLIGSKKKSKPTPSPKLTASPEVKPSLKPNPSSLPSLQPLASLSPAPTPSPSPSPSPSPTTQTLTLKSQANLDGFRSSNDGGNDSLDARVGRNTFLTTRGFISFNLSPLPNHIVIESVKLKAYQEKIIGDPYGAGIRVMIDHLDYGDSLGIDDYGSSSISSSFNTLSDNDSIEWKEIDVTDQVRDDLNQSRSRSQYRLHLAIENIGGTVSGDFIYFESGNNSQGTNNLPELTIKYH